MLIPDGLPPPTYANMIGVQRTDTGDVIISFFYGERTSDGNGGTTERRVCVGRVVLNPRVAKTLSEGLRQDTRASD